MRSSCCSGHSSVRIDLEGILAGQVLEKVTEGLITALSSVRKLVAMGVIGIICSRPNMSPQALLAAKEKEERKRKERKKENNILR